MRDYHERKVKLFRWNIFSFLLVVSLCWCATHSNPVSDGHNTKYKDAMLREQNSFYLRWYVFDVGGVNSSSANYGHRAALGQTVVGETQSTSYIVYSGFFYPEAIGAVCGDINGDDLVNAADLSYLANYLFFGGPPPISMWAADVNGDGNVNAADLSYLANYLFFGGPVPDCPTLRVINFSNLEKKMLRKGFIIGKKLP